MQHPKPQRERAVSHACGQVSARARLSLTAYESYVTVGSITCVIGIALQIKKWRRALHAYDPPDLDLADGTESQDSVSDSEVPAPLRLHSWARFLLTHRGSPQMGYIHIARAGFRDCAALLPALACYVMAV